MAKAKAGKRTKRFTRRIDRGQRATATANGATFTVFTRKGRQHVQVSGVNPRLSVDDAT